MEPAASRLRIEDRVGVAWSYQACGRCPHCRAGNEDLCGEFQRLAAGICIKTEVQELGIEAASRALMNLKSRKIRGGVPGCCDWIDPESI